MSESQKRQVAVKVRINQILEATYVKEEGWDPNYMKLSDGSRCSRANVIGVIIEIPEETDPAFDHFTLDDGSASIVVRVFDQRQLLKGMTVGTVVLVIGRPREYQGTKYIVPEIVKKIQDHRWVKFRKKELGDVIAPKEEKPVVKKEPKMELPKDPYHEMIALIRELDRGDGADIEAITSSAKVSNADSIIESLLREGEIFELRPGKLKVLE